MGSVDWAADTGVGSAVVAADSAAGWAVAEEAAISVQVVVAAAGWAAAAEMPAPAVGWAAAAGWAAGWAGLEMVAADLIPSSSSHKPPWL